MEKTRTTSDLPLRPMGYGETLVQVFRSAAEQGAGDDGHETESTPLPRSPTSPRRGGSATQPSLQRRLFEADGRPVRLGRSDVLRSVGAGGLGVVYEAVHAEHGHRVALKTLRWMTAAGLSRFKNEFRSLCGVAHPNLVALYELGAEDDEWFFTMELVEGDSFVEHVQSDSGRPLGGWEYLGETLADDLPSGVHGEERVGREARDGIGALDLAALRDPGAGEPWARGFHTGRLRAALRQLATAVAALHDLGKLHRDLNPGNVLVTREGRVVVLDFGLICEREPRRGAPYDGACGTPAYMSPEQGAGKPATAASDWYGFGVMLFEALTGQLPFTGSAGRMLGNKRLQDAPPPSMLTPGLPADLEALCVALLRRAPDERPDAAAVLEALGVSRRRARPPEPASDAFFTGRRAELDTLDDALRAAGEGRPVAVVLHGPPGIGKTSLLGRFLDQAAARPEAVVLRGACRARETIPHRTLDAIVDALGAHLTALPEADARAAIPEGARDLARLFPVLAGVPAIADLPPHRPSPAAAPIDDPREAEEAAFACLREVLARLAATRTVVIGVDDAHLGDPGGARRLADLVAPDPPGSPPGGRAAAVLIVMAHDDDALGSSLVLTELSRAIGDARHVAIGPLAEAEARELARAALPAHLPGREAIASAIAVTSEGSPLAVEDLALHVAEAGGEVSRDDVVAARLAHLSEHALRLVEVAAAVGGPIERGLLLQVGEAGPYGDAALADLTAARLLRATAGGPGGADRIAIHDERTRAVVASRTPAAATRRIHLDLGHALAARPGADPEAAAECFQRAEAPELSAEHFRAAAERAMAGRVHDRAAELFALALACTARSSTECRALLARRAEALAAAGRSAEAAEAYLEGAAGAPRGEALSRQRRAAEPLRVAGDVAGGRDMLRAVRGAHAVRWPETPRRALGALAARLLALRLRGAGLPEPTGADPHGAAPPSAFDAARIEALWSTGKGLATLDPLRAALFALEAHLAALATGDADHAALSLSLTGSMLVSQGGAADEVRGLDLIDEAARLARRSGDAYLTGFSWFCSGLARLFAGRFRDALVRLDEALGMLQERGDALAWERHAHRVASLRALFDLGALRERAHRADAWLREARARGDRAGEAQATLASSLTVLAGGDPAGARAAARQASLSWRGGFGLPQHAALMVEISSLLYEGAAVEARARLLAAWPALAASQLLRVQLVRVEATLLRGLTALAVGRPDLHRLVALDAARLAREKRPHALAAAALLRAGIARDRGEITRALDGLDEAARGYASAEMRVHAASARRARGALLGGPPGRALVADADAVLGAEGVVDGARWAAMVTGAGS